MPAAKKPVPQVARTKKSLRAGRKDFIVYKKVRLHKPGAPNRSINFMGFGIVTLQIPAGASRNVPYGADYLSMKCRAAKAKVLKIEHLDGRKPRRMVAHSDYHFSFIYRVGRWIEPNIYDQSWDICAPGIHFFRTRRQAEQYRL